MFGFKLKNTIHNTKKIPLTIESISKLLPFVDSFKDMYGSLFLIRDGKFQLMKPWESRHHKLIKKSLRGFLRKECLQIEIENNFGEITTGHIIKGKKSHVSSLSEIRNYIFGLKQKVNFDQIKRVRLLHTHLSEETIEVTDSGVKLTINGLSSRDIYTKNYLAEHLGCSVFVEAITPNGHYYSI